MNIYRYISDFLHALCIRVIHLFFPYMVILHASAGVLPFSPSCVPNIAFSLSRNKFPVAEASVLSPNKENRGYVRAAEGSGRKTQTIVS